MRSTPARKKRRFIFSMITSTDGCDVAVSSAAPRGEIPNALARVGHFGHFGQSRTFGALNPGAAGDVLHVSRARTIGFSILTGRATLLVAVRRNASSGGVSGHCGGGTRPTHRDGRHTQASHPPRGTSRRRCR